MNDAFQALFWSWSLEVIHRTEEGSGLPVSGCAMDGGYEEGGDNGSPSTATSKHDKKQHLKQVENKELGVVAHTCNSSTGETEAGGLL